MIVKYAIIFNLCLIGQGLMSQNPIPADQMLINTTIKIECFTKRINNGSTTYTRTAGTGFFFAFNDNGGLIPVIVTNRHVVKDVDRVLLYFKREDETGKPLYGSTERIVITNFRELWIGHPDSTVDLAIFPLRQIVTQYETQTRRKLFYALLTENFIPTDSIKSAFSAIKDVLMVGYPYGLRDTINDLPIVRKGMTATPIFSKYNGKKEFLVDLPVFYGSSGSPIIIYEEYAYGDNNSPTVIGNNYRAFLAGINYATYTHDFTGKVLPNPIINNSDSLQVKTNLPLYNIGVVIMAERLLEFKPLIRQRR